MYCGRLSTGCEMHGRKEIKAIVQDLELRGRQGIRLPHRAHQSGREREVLAGMSLLQKELRFSCKLWVTRDIDQARQACYRPEQ